MNSESTNQLANLGEEDEDFDQLNNETFGELSNNHDDWEYEHERLAESEVINVDNLPFNRDAIDPSDNFQPLNFLKYPPPPILTPFSSFPPPPDLSKFASSHNLEDEVELAMHESDLALQLSRLVMENEEEEEKFNKARHQNNITSESSWFCKNGFETPDSLLFFSDSFDKKPQQSSLGELVSNTTPLSSSGIKSTMTLEELEAFLMANDEKKDSDERKDKESTQSSWPPQPTVTSTPQRPPLTNVVKDPLQHIHEQFKAQRNCIQQQQQHLLIQFHQIQQQAVQVQQRLITNSRHPLNSTQLQQQINLRQQQQHLIKYQRYLQQCMQQLQHDHLVLQHQYRNVVQQKQAAIKQEDILKTQQSTTSFPQYQQQNFQQQQMIMMRQQDASLMSLPPHLQQSVPLLPQAQTLAQPYPQRSPDDPFYNGLMEQREKDWLVKIQLLQLHTHNPLIDDYYYTCWSVKKLMKENKKLKKSAEKDRKEKEKSDKSPEDIENGKNTESDESENEDDDEDAGKVAQLLISTDIDGESRIYTPVQFEKSLGKLTATSIYNPRKALDVHVSLNVDEAKKQDDKKLKEVLYKIEKGFDMLLQADELHNKLSKVDLDMRDNLEIKRFELIEKLTADLLNNDCHSFLQMLNIRKGVVMITRWMPLITKEEEQDLVLKNLMFKLNALIKKDWCHEVSKKLYKSIAAFLIKINNMESLIAYSVNICKPCKSKNLDKFVATLVNNKLSISCIFLLVVRMENLLEKHQKSPLEKLTDYNKWKDFIEVVGRCLSKLESPVILFNSKSSESFISHLGKFLKSSMLTNVCSMLQLTPRSS